jgi:16S rRNA (guanine(1405)-N(7))-methyltransferase
MRVENARCAAMNPPDEAPPLVDLVVSAARQSKRYARIDEAVVRRCAAEAVVAARGRLPDAIKRTKRCLHQVYGAYVGISPRYDRLLTRLREARRGDGGERLARELRSVMAVHASTRERVPHLDRFYAALFDRVGTVRSVLDAGCGLNPLAAPWMRLAPGATYTAVDIDSELVGFVGACLELIGVQARPLVSDIVSGPLPHEADLALLLKMVPCLEQQRRGAGAEAIRGLRARHVAVSFPIRSLGGRGKGMPATYARLFSEMVARERWTAEEIAAPGELLYLITK